MKIRLNQTVIKQLKEFNLAEPNFCPAQIRYLSFSEELQSLPPSEAMRKGIVFETHALGLKPRANGESDIPLLKNGTVPVAYTRIMEQVNKFKSIATHFGMFPSQIQETIRVDYSEDVELFGTVDFVSPIHIMETSYPKAIIDLKLTGNIENPFGPFSWATPEKMDHTQAFMYTYLYEMKYGERLPFFYMVFDYSTKKGHKIVHKKVEDCDIDMLHESIDQAQKKLRFFQENEWMEIPEPKRCEFCPLRFSCKSFNQGTNDELRQLLFDLT